MAVIIPIFVAAIRAVRRDYWPVGDDAILFVRTRDVLTSHHPFLGSWTSASHAVGEDMNNPGSMYDWLIAPFSYALSPGAAAAFGVATVNAVSVALASSVAHRIGGWSMQRWVLLAAAALTWTMGSELLIDIFQVHALMLPFFALLIVTIGCATGHGFCVPLYLGVGSLLIQTHISYVYILAILTAAALAVLWVEHRPVDLRRRLPTALGSRTALVSYAVVAVLWIQPLWEQFFGPGKGNISRLASSGGGGDLKLGTQYAVEIAAALYVTPRWWTRWGFTDRVRNRYLTGTTDGGAHLILEGLPSLAASFIGLALVVAILVMLTRAVRRAGDSVAFVSGVLAIVGLVGSVVCMAMVTLGPVGFVAAHVRWVWVVAVFVHVVILWVGMTLLGARWDGWRRAATPIAVIVTLVFAAGSLVYVAHPSGAIEQYDAIPIVRRTFGSLDQLQGHDPVLYDTRNLRAFEPFSSAVIVRMQELGIEFRVNDDGWARQYGETRRSDGSEPTTLFQLERLSAVTYYGDACRLTLVSALDPVDQLAAEQDVDRLTDALMDGSIIVHPNPIVELDPDGDLSDAERRGLWRHFVLEGQLFRAVLEHRVTVDPNGPFGDVADVSAPLPRIAQFVATAFGLFVLADDDFTCEAES